MQKLNKTYMFRTFKSLLKYIKAYLSKWKGKIYSWIILSVIKFSILFKLLCKNVAISIKMPTIFIYLVGRCAWNQTAYSKVQIEKICNNVWKTKEGQWG